jgi:hypothetical protein
VGDVKQRPSPAIPFATPAIFPHSGIISVYSGFWYSIAFIFQLISYCFYFYSPSFPKPEPKRLLRKKDE